MDFSNYTIVNNAGSFKFYLPEDAEAFSDGSIVSTRKLKFTKTVESVNAEITAMQDEKIAKQNKIDAENEKIDVRIANAQSMLAVMI